MGLAIAVLSATRDTPLTVAFLDMNGLTGINNTHGHGVGDKAIYAFFEAVASTLGQCGEVYRNGGDEVVAILPNVTDEQASKLLDGLVRQLGKDAFPLGDGTSKTTLTASCGATSITDHHDDDVDKILERADTVLYRAKHESGTSKEYVGRVSAIAVGDGAVSTYPGSGDVTSR